MKRKKTKTGALPNSVGFPGTNMVKYNGPYNAPYFITGAKCSPDEITITGVWHPILYGPIEDYVLNSNFIVKDINGNVMSSVVKADDNP